MGATYARSEEISAVLRLHGTLAFAKFSRSMPSFRRALGMSFTALLLALPVPATANAACANADARPTAGTLDDARSAVRCLINVERGRRGLPRLAAQRNLRDASTGLARKMVEDHFFDHVTPSGETLVKRVRKAGYVSRKVASYAVAENLGYGTNDLSTPREIVRGWMKSSGHRANLLSARYDEIGVGVVLGSPFGDGDARTYVTEFGVRKLH